MSSNRKHIHISDVILRLASSNWNLKFKIQIILLRLKCLVVILMELGEAIPVMLETEKNSTATTLE